MLAPCRAFASAPVRACTWAKRMGLLRRAPSSRLAVFRLVVTAGRSLSSALRFACACGPLCHRSPPPIPPRRPPSSCNTAPADAVSKQRQMEMQAQALVLREEEKRMEAEVAAYRCASIEPADANTGSTCTRAMTCGVSISCLMFHSCRLRKR